MRPLIEASLRTIWIAEDATEEQVKEILKRRTSDLPLLGELNGCFTVRDEKPMNGKMQGILHDFTHGGPAAMAAHSS